MSAAASGRPIANWLAYTMAQQHFELQIKLYVLCKLQVIKKTHLRFLIMTH